MATQEIVQGNALGEEMGVFRREGYFIRDILTIPKTAEVVEIELLALTKSANLNYLGYHIMDCDLICFCIEQNNPFAQHFMHTPC
jgi:hypothetical protein